MYIVLIREYTKDYLDTYTSEYSGVKHDTYKDALNELSEAKRKYVLDGYVTEVWIEEV